jgi:hypothetical protein
MFHALNKTINIEIIHLKTSFIFKVRLDSLLEDLKCLIEKHENINMLYYYLFLENINLLDSYNKFNIKKILEIANKEVTDNNNSESDIVLYLLNREDYMEIVCKLNILSCETHMFNKAYLYCSTCEKLICDKCNITEHKDHKHIFDQALFLDTYFIKLRHIETKFMNLYSETKLVNYRKVVDDMNRNLNKYLEKEKGDVIKTSEEIKKYIDKLRDLEIERIDIFGKAAQRKIVEVEHEASTVFQIHKTVQGQLMIKDLEIENFSKIDIEKKVEYLKEIQKKNAELMSNQIKIEKIIERFRNMRDNDIYKLLECNKDYSFTINLEKFKTILLKKINKLQNKMENENASLLVENMEKLKQKSLNSKIYNRLLNLNQVERILEFLEKEKLNEQEIGNMGQPGTPTPHKENQSLNSQNLKNNLNNINSLTSITNNIEIKILQPIDLTATVNVLDAKTLKVSTSDIIFIDPNNEVNTFPKFSRSINMNYKLYVSGGEFEDGLVDTLIEVDTQTLEARHLHPMGQRRSAHCLLNLHNEKLIVISGAYCEHSCEQYLIAYDRWEPFPKVITSRVGACALFYGGETIYLFFGKSYDSSERKWTFHDTIEKINLFTPYPEWEEVHFKTKNTEINRQIAFASIITCPNDRMFILGGHTPNGPIVDFYEDVLEVEMEKELISVSEFPLPKQFLFLESNFYFYNFNALSFDNEGSAIIYSVIFNDMWVI